MPRAGLASSLPQDQPAAINSSGAGAEPDPDTTLATIGGRSADRSAARSYPRAADSSSDSDVAGDDGGGDDGQAPGICASLALASKGSTNVWRTFTFNLIDGASFSIWQATVLQKFLYEVGGNSNALVGYIAGATGAAQVLAGISSSVLSDRKFKRQHLVRAASLAGLCGVALVLTAAYTLHTGIFFVAAACWGVYVGMNNPSVEALFADSVSSRIRASVYTAKWIVQILSYLAGSATTIGLFAGVGNHWNYDEMRYVMVGGLSVHTLAFLMLWTLRDDRKLAAAEVAAATDGGTAGEDNQPGVEDEGTQPRDEHRTAVDVDAAAGGANPGSCATPTAPPAGEPQRASPSDHPSRSGSAEDGAEWDTRQPSTLPNGSQSSHSPMARDSTLAADAAGDSPVALPVRSPLVNTEVSYHRRHDYRTETGSPTRVRHRRVIAEERLKKKTNEREAARLKAAAEAAYFDDEANKRDGTFRLFTKRGIPFWIVFGDLTQSIAAGMTLRYFPLFFIQTYGTSPIKLTILFSCGTVVMSLAALAAKLIAAKITKNRVAAALLFRLCGVACTYYMAYAPGSYANFYPMAVVFVFRMAFMNSIYGLTRSVIMDHVPSAQRARWSAVESVAGFSWAGSAIVGGIIADKHGYRSTFGITASIGVAACCFMIPPALMVKDAVFASPEEYAAKMRRAARSMSASEEPTADRAALGQRPQNDSPARPLLESSPAADDGDGDKAGDGGYGSVET